VIAAIFENTRFGGYFRARREIGFDLYGERRAVR